MRFLNNYFTMHNFFACPITLPLQVSRIVALCFVVLVLVNPYFAFAQSANVIEKGQPGTREKVLIVFVHGFLGSPGETWSNPVTKANFPSLLRTDSRLSNIDTFVFSYRTSVVGSSLNISEIAANLELVLDSVAAPSDYDAIIFVGHSLGGLVIREALLSFSPLAQKSRMIYLFGTPTSGSQVASVARLFSNSSTLSQLAVSTPDTYLGGVVNRWNRATLPDGRRYADVIRSHCAYERLPTNGILIVPQSSATTLCNGETETIDANHLDLVKPSDRQAASYLRVFRAVRDSQRLPIAVVNASQSRPAAISGSEPKVPKVTPATEPTVTLRTPVANDPKSAPAKSFEDRQIAFKPQLKIGMRKEAIAGALGFEPSWQLSSDQPPLATFTLDVSFANISGQAHFFFRNGLLGSARWGLESESTVVKWEPRFSDNRTEKLTGVSEATHTDRCATYKQKVVNELVRLSDAPTNGFRNTETDTTGEVERANVSRRLVVQQAIRNSQDATFATANARFSPITYSFSEARTIWTEERTHSGNVVFGAETRRSFHCQLSLRVSS